MCLVESISAILYVVVWIMHYPLDILEARGNHDLEAWSRFVGLVKARKVATDHIRTKCQDDSDHRSTTQQDNQICSARLVSSDDKNIFIDYAVIMGEKYRCYAPTLPSIANGK